MRQRAGIGAFRKDPVAARKVGSPLVDELEQLFAIAQQACFFQTAPCPGRDDPRLVWLVVAFFVVPLVWLLGLLLLAVRAMMRGAR